MLLTEAELAPLMQRKAQIQATLKQNTIAASASVGSCASNSGGCPSCQGESSASAGASAGTTTSRGALMLVLGALALLGLGWWAFSSGVIG